MSRDWKLYLRDGAYAQGVEDGLAEAKETAQLDLDGAGNSRQYREQRDQFKRERDQARKQVEELRQQLDAQMEILREQNESLEIAKRDASEEDYFTPRDKFLMAEALSIAHAAQAYNLIQEARYRLSAFIGDVASIVISVEDVPEQQRAERIAFRLKVYERQRTWESVLVEAAYEYERTFRDYRPLIEAIEPGSTYPDEVRKSIDLAGEFVVGLHALFPESGSLKDSDGGEKLRSVVAEFGGDNIRETIRSLQRNPIKLSTGGRDQGPTPVVQYALTEMRAIRKLHKCTRGEAYERFMQHLLSRDDVQAWQRIKTANRAALLNRQTVQVQTFHMIGGLNRSQGGEKFREMERNHPEQSG